MQFNFPSVFDQLKPVLILFVKMPLYLCPYHCHTLNYFYPVKCGYLTQATNWISIIRSSAIFFSQSITPIYGNRFQHSMKSEERNQKQKSAGTIFFLFSFCEVIFHTLFSVLSREITVYEHLPLWLNIQRQAEFNALYLSF